MTTNDTQAEAIAKSFTWHMKQEIGHQRFALMVSRDNDLAEDVTDPNQIMIDAFKNVMGREPWFASDVDEGLAKMAQVYADHDLIESAWDLARNSWRKARPIGRDDWRDAWGLARRSLWHLQGEQRQLSKLAHHCLCQRRSAEYPYAPISQRLLDWQFKRHNA